MSNIKITELPEATATSVSDMTIVVSNPAGFPTTQKTTLSNLFGAVLTALRSIISPGNNKIPYFTGPNSAGVLSLDQDIFFAADSDTALPSQRAVKAYVARQLSSFAVNGGMLARVDHVQSVASAIWTVIHSLNTPVIPVVHTYTETTETVALAGYCGSGCYCGDGITSGSGSTVNARVETDLPHVDIRLVSQDRFDIRFATPQTGKASILF